MLSAYINNMRMRFGLLPFLLWILVACGPSRASDLALVGAKIYPSPTEPAIDNGAILVHEGRIVAVGPMVTINTILAEALDHLATGIEAQVAEGVDFNIAVQSNYRAPGGGHGSRTSPWALDEVERGWCC